MQRWVSYENAMEDLEGRDPSQRLGALLVEYRSGGLSLSIEDLRKLFIYAWADGAHAREFDQERSVLTLLRWIAPVRDAEIYLSGTHIIYRPVEGAENGIVWTLDEAVARAASPNGIVQGEVESNEVLAHLTASGKNHVLADPEDIGDVRPL